MQLNTIYNEDCIKGMERIDDKSVDLVLTDLPYGFTDCEWDKIIPFDLLWKQYNRIVKDSGAIVLFSAQPFTTKLINSNLKNFRYCWYWKKNNKTGFAFARYQPMRCIEDICVFCADKSNAGRHLELRKYFFDELKKSGKKRTDIDALLNNSMSSHYFTHGAQFSIPNERDYKKLQSTGYFQKPYEDIKKEYAAQRGKTPYTYNPQGIKKLDNPRIRTKRNADVDSVYKLSTLSNEYKQKYTGYPVHLLEFKNEVTSNKNRLHPTQKPLALCEYLVKTYTNAGDLVVDSCAGSGTTLLAAKMSGRNYIGFETDAGYFEVAVKRLSAHNATERNENTK